MTFEEWAETEASEDIRDDPFVAQPCAREAWNAAKQEQKALLEMALEALTMMTEHYAKLAGCGDCGSWNPEAEPEVIQARSTINTLNAALKEMR